MEVAEEKDSPSWLAMFPFESQGSWLTKGYFVMVHAGQKLVTTLPANDIRTCDTFRRVNAICGYSWDKNK